MYWMPPLVPLTLITVVQAFDIDLYYLMELHILEIPGEHDERKGEKTKTKFVKIMRLSLALGYCDLFKYIVKYLDETWVDRPYGVISQVS